MKRVFGTKKDKAPPPSIEDATGNINSRGDTIDEKIRKLDEQLVKARTQISRTRPGASQEMAKRRALQILKQKRMYEGQRDQLYQQQYNLEQVAFTTESVKDTVSTVQALKGAHKELKTQMKKKEFNIDKIEQLQDDMTDLMDVQNDIQEALGRTYDLPDEIDESELMDELDALEADMAMESSNAEQGAVPSYLQDDSLPEAPLELPNAVPAGQQPQDQAVDEFGLPAMPQRN
ncbi:hypothetical protein BSKO_14105 [Bryopsis sp. KO-2023]|nr:hypothetical protein BSKO_14105 [Bryopsis sp. KO-2023]